MLWSCTVLGMKNERLKIPGEGGTCSPLYLQYHSSHLTLGSDGELTSHPQCLGSGAHSALRSWEDLREVGGLGKQGPWSDPPLTLLPELIYESFSHSIPNSCPSRTHPMLCLGYGAGISSGTLGTATHTDTLRGSATHSVPLRYLCHDIKLHTLLLRHNHIPVTYTGSSSHTFCPFLHTWTPSHTTPCISHTLSPHILWPKPARMEVWRVTHIFRATVGPWPQTGTAPTEVWCYLRIPRTSFLYSGYLCLYPDFSSFLQFLLIPSPSTPMLYPSPPPCLLALFPHLPETPSPPDSLFLPRSTPWVPLFTSPWCPTPPPSLFPSPRCPIPSLTCLPLQPPP